jgi:hypothetical protein
MENDTQIEEIINETIEDSAYYNDEFFGNIRILAEEPKRVKHDEGYEYETEYQNSIFKLGNNYLFTDISTSHTIQMSIFRIVLSNIFDHITINKETNEKINIIEEKLNQSQYTITDNHDNLLDKISKLEQKLNNKINKIFDIIPTTESIEKNIDDKMFSFQQLRQNNDLSETNNQSKGSVLTVTQLAVLKEQFDTADDLVKLREAQLI